MCDHCVKRDRAYSNLTEDERDEVDLLQLQSNAKLTMLALTKGQDSDEFLNAYLAAGDEIDLALGIAAPTIPDTVPPDWVTE